MIYLVFRSNLNWFKDHHLLSPWFSNLFRVQLLIWWGSYRCLIHMCLDSSRICGLWLLFMFLKYDTTSSVSDLRGLLNEVLDFLLLWQIFFGKGAVILSYNLTLLICRDVCPSWTADTSLFHLLLLLSQSILLLQVQFPFLLFHLLLKHFI